MQIIPAVDVLNGSVVRLLKGRYDDVTVYASDPVSVASDWIAQGASLVHVVDLNGARTGEPDAQLWEALAASGIAFQIGGGIRARGVAREAIEAGAQRVVVGTVAVHDDRVLGEIVSEIGPKRVVAAIDVRKDRARGAGWTDAGVPLGDVVDRIVESGVTTALVTGIERDGAMNGPNLELLTRVQTAAPTLGLIASGGIDSLRSIAALGPLDCEGAIVGRALYEGSVTLPDAIATASSES